MQKNYIQNSEVPDIFEKELIKLYPNAFQKSNEINQSLFLHGKPGTGKTLKAISLVFNSLYQNKHFQRRIQNNFQAAPDFIQDRFKFCNVSDLLFRLRQTYKIQFWKKSEKELTPEEEIIQMYQKPDYLILDDLGVEKSTDWSLQTLYLIINHRYENEKITIVTSNYSPEELEIKMEDGRIISRLTAMGLVIHCTKQYRNV